MQLFAEPLILLFGSTSPEVVNDGVYYLRICCGINSLIYAAMYTLDSFSIGAGAANVAMFNALLDARRKAFDGSDDMASMPRMRK